MYRASQWAFGVVVVLAIATGESRAQGGYGRYGWGGWGGGSTVQGDIARGLGFYDIGRGVYNRETAIANSINTDTVIRWNQYLWLSQQEANRREYLRRARRQQIDSMNGALVHKRLRDNPTADDIENGDALNVILDQVTDPRIHSSALRLATAPISAAAIRQIPFVNASEAVTISLHQLAAKDAWPLALIGEDFAEERKAYQQAAAQALEEDKEGDLSAATLAKLRAASSRLRTKLEQAPPQDQPQRTEAENFVKLLIGMARMLEFPDVEKALAELESLKSTTLGSLLGFMHNYNFRFGPARTAEQRAVYRELYPLMASQRDRIVKESGVDLTVSPGANNPPVNFFQGMHMDHLEGKAPNSQPRPNGR